VSGDPTQSFRDLIRRRLSSEAFDPRRPVGDDQIRALVADACEAPSSFNIQHWRFIAVRDAEARRRLCAAAFDQRQIMDAPVTFIVLGDCEGIDRLPEVMQRAVDEAVLPAGKAEAWQRLAKQIYETPQLARDEALRSASLAAMVMMLSAEAHGLASGPLIGFDAPRVKSEFHIADRFEPVMLLVVGYPIGGPASRKPRLTVDEVLVHDDGADL